MIRTHGVLHIGEKRIYYWIRINDFPSESGIDGGKVTRLTMKVDGVWAYRFEDGAVTLEIRSVETNRAVEMLLIAYN